ncbi:G5 domain-containing protein [Actinoplanes flavus]|uniref:G5 domain-containing protein n=1 Tax=Actinoplanes flavus TaxID=2820290 RepID=A0ABS3UNR9_9ACTN|nr:G5 domain-containing protein [Actinoplanes flavus]MBO3740406.1 G5 domain-containing protein [Actinoplanes flavus]
MPRKSWWAQLPFGVRMAAGAGALVVLVGGGAAGISTMTGSDGTPAAATAEAATAPDPGAARLEEDPEVVSRAAAAAQPLPKRHGHTPPPPAPPGKPAGTDQLSRARVADERADRTGPRPAHPRGKRAGRDRREPAAGPVVTTRTDERTRVIPFRTKVVRDPALPRGTRFVRSPGVPGEETARYLVTLTDGKQTARRLLGRTVTRKPENRVVVFGALRRSALDPACEHALDLCVPMGRAAVCPPEATPGPATTPAPGTPVTPAPATLVTEEDLLAAGEELLDGVRLEPASLC